MEYNVETTGVENIAETLAREVKSPLAFEQTDVDLKRYALPAGYVAVAKSFVNNRPLTRVSITPAGRTAFAAYLEALGGLIGGKG